MIKHFIPLKLKILINLIKILKLKIWSVKLWQFKFTNDDES